MAADAKIVADFGEEWAAFDQSQLAPAERKAAFDTYFSIFPFDALPANAEGFDLGCGSGRWAAIMSSRIGKLHCIDPAAKALAVAMRNAPGCEFHLADAETMPLPDGSQDFGYSLGVLHHVEDVQGALTACVRKLKPGAPFLLYLYYALDGRPTWYRLVWEGSDLLRRIICRLPFGAKKAVTSVIAALAYWPLSRLSRLAGSSFPLWAYRNYSFYILRTDALDRFGTRVEKRFTRQQVRELMEIAGLTDIRFNDRVAFWTAVGYRRSVHQR
jgi:ubiquinone/menaquinone biosynthesis C-methylase UbiE